MESPILKYGLITLFTVITAASFYTAVFKYKTVDTQGKTTYHISRSIGLFITALFALYITYNLVLNKPIDMGLINELGNQLSSVGRNVTNITLG